MSRAINSAMQVQEFRELIKTQVLLKQNGDHEVVIASLLNESINGQSLESTLNQYMSDGKTCRDILTEFPTLTIGVPTLPEGSFAPKAWDASVQIPKVATRLIGSNHVPIVDREGFVEIDPKYIPGFPIVVVKLNERVISSLTGGYELYQEEPILFKSIYNVDYKLTSQNYLESTMKTTIHMVSLEQKIRDAYYLYRNISGWQRDYIYYDITPTSPNGSYKNNFKETITRLEFSPNPTGALNQIANQDGSFSGGYNTVPYWTDQLFEFAFNIQLNASSGLGPSVTMKYGISFYDLFIPSFSSIQLAFGRFYYFSGLRSKSKPLNIEIDGWDLNKYSIAWKVNLTEEDATGSNTVNISRSAQFAANVSGTTKVGLEFGVSGTTTETRSESISIALGNDDLGDAILNFSDNVMVWGPPNDGPYNTPRQRAIAGGLYDISGGMYLLNVRPVKVF